MIVGLPGLSANQLPLAADSIAVDVKWLPYVAILGAVAGIWVFFKILELVRRLFIPLVLGAVLVLLGQVGVDWPLESADGLWPFGSAGATERSTDIPPMGDFRPR